MEEDSNKPKAKGRRNNKRRNRNKSRGPPPTPSIKIQIRNLISWDLDHLVEKVNEVVDTANEKLAFKMTLNKDHLEDLVKDQKTAFENAEQFKAQQLLSTNLQEQGEDGENANNDNPPTTTTTTTVPSNHASKKESKQYLEATKNVSRLTLETPNPNRIATSVLYFVPPKSSARRGVIPGTLYMVLTAPEIEILKSVTEGDHPSGSGPGDHSRAIAKRKLQLTAALDAIVSTQPDLDIHEAVNNKTWRCDEQETTTNFLETEDYKEFVESSKLSQEERRNRPKPAPGGGTSATTTTKEPPIAALVIHLQKKLELEKKRKQARRKESKKKKGTASTTNASTNGNNNKIRKRGRKKKRPSKQPPSNGTAAPPPVSGGG